MSHTTLDSNWIGGDETASAGLVGDRLRQEGLEPESGHEWPFFERPLVLMFVVEAGVNHRTGEPVAGDINRVLAA